MKLGDKVYWTSQAQGFTKRKEGVIVAVVPMNQDPKDYVPQDAGGVFFQLKFPGGFRDHESYLIRVGKKRTLYWPLAKNLHMDIRNVGQKFCKCGNKVQECGTCDSCVPPVKEIA